MTSGLLLVTGPYKVNGVPLKRVNQAYVQPTTTKVDITGVDVASIDDAFFARVEVKKTRANLFKPDAKVIFPILNQISIFYKVVE